MCGAGAEVEFPRSCVQEAPRALQISWGILLAQGLVQNKGQSVFCIPNGNVNSPLHTGLPCKMPQKSDQWPQGS